MSLPRVLDPVEIRVLGCLLEKQLLTPEYYPLTVNALLAACNQRSSREPVMELADGEVAAALDRLAEHVLVWKSAGARSERWLHNLDRRLALDPPAKAVLALLFLRGPQTPGELRARAERMHAFATTVAVEEALCALAAGDELAARLTRLEERVEALAGSLAGLLERLGDR